ncbi:MAG TPA: PAS domain S-box protein [Candidatus Hydrogenedentes bacterium]|nr:PAS domain S-box protein [Candidatus Hydrogenedentota bacterium]HOL76980.1 PAS domain S-box protein [Candidatus Hydrogenedentota bacterium]HPO86630.1 PAS domain S-box protein [Candidatus Hydrogenedentota bacterium]
MNPSKHPGAGQPKTGTLRELLLPVFCGLFAFLAAIGLELLHDRYSAQSTGYSNLTHEIFAILLIVCAGVFSLLAIYRVALQLAAAKKAEAEARLKQSAQEEEVRRAQEALQQSEERYRLLFERARDGIAVFGKDLRILMMNPRFIEITGYTPSDSFYNSPIDAVHPEDRSLVLENYRKRWAGEPAEKTYVFRLRRKDGAIIHVEGSFDLLTQNDTPIGVLAILRDISSRARIMNALRVIAQGVWQGVGTEFYAHILFQIVQALEVRCAILALERPEDETLEVVAGNVDRRPFKTVFRIPAGSPLFSEILRTGDICYLHRPLDTGIFENTPLAGIAINSGAGVPILTPSGAVIGVLAVFHHEAPLRGEQVEFMLRVAAARISSEIERTRIEEDLRLSESRLRTLFEGIDDLIFVYNQEGRIIDCNVAACHQVGVTREQLLGKNIAEVRSDAAGKEGVEKEREALQTESLIIGADGRKIPVLVSRRTIQYQGSQATLELAHDISQRKKHEEQQRRLHAQLYSMQRLESLGVLAGGVAHEFNNILMGVLCNASLIEKQLPPNSPVLSYVERVIAAAERAAKLSKEMLTFTGKSPVQHKKLELSKVITEIRELLEASISKKAELNVNAHAEPVHVMADENQLREVVFHLVVNASDALQDKSGEIEITMGIKDVTEEDLEGAFFMDKPKPGRYAYLEVRDTGVGITPENMSRLFEPFFTTKFVGRGVGLAAVMGIVRSHKGFIKVVSATGHGATFTVYLPALIGEPEACRPQPASRIAAGKTILVVDDQSVVIEPVREVLTSAGYEVLLARDGEEAVQVFRDNLDKVGLVLLDATMPRMGGEEVFRHIHAMRPEVLVILSSGYSADQTGSTLEGIAGFLQKPYKMDELLKMVDSLLLKTNSGTA